MAPMVPTATPASTAPAITGCSVSPRLAGRIDHLDGDALLLEDAGLAAELGDRGVPVAALADRQLDDVIGAGGEGRSRARTPRRTPSRQASVHVGSSWSSFAARVAPRSLIAHGRVRKVCNVSGACTSVVFVHVDRFNETDRIARDGIKIHGPHSGRAARVARRLEGWPHTLRPVAVLRDARKSALLRTRFLTSSI